MSRATSARGQLLAPFVEYFRIEFQGKWGLGVVLPVGIAASAGLAFARMPFNLTSDGGLVDSTLPLLALLVGFFITALGLCATMTSEFLDTIPDTPPMRGGEEITFRAFLTALFGHLVLTTICTHILGVALLIGAPIIPHLANGSGWSESHVLVWLRAVFGGAYVFLVMHLLVSTVQSLYFIGPRLQRARDDEVRPLTKDERSAEIKKKAADTPTPVSSTKTRRTPHQQP